MKHVLIILLFLPLTLFSQATDITEKGKFFIGLNFSPDYSYRHLIQNGDDFSDMEWKYVKNIQDSIFIPKYGYTAGIAFGYHINKMLNIETGIIYSNKGYKTISTETVYDFYRPPENAQSILDYTYLGIPLKANVIFFDERFQLIMGFGATLDILLRKSVKIIPDNPTTRFPIQKKYIDYDYNKINISPIVSIGMKYNITHRMSLRAEPTFRYSVLKLDDKSYVETHLYSVGLNIGFYLAL